MRQLITHHQANKKPPAATVTQLQNGGLLSEQEIKVQVVSRWQIPV